MHWQGVSWICLASTLVGLVVLVILLAGVTWKSWDT